MRTLSPVADPVLAAGSANLRILLEVSGEEIKEVRICRVWFVPHRVVYTTMQCTAAEETLRLAARMRRYVRIRAVKVFREEAATAQKIR